MALLEPSGESASASASGGVGSDASMPVARSSLRLGVPSASVPGQASMPGTPIGTGSTVGSASGRGVCVTAAAPAVACPVAGEIVKVVTSPSQLDRLSEVILGHVANAEMVSMRVTVSASAADDTTSFRSHLDGRVKLARLRLLFKL